MTNLNARINERRKNLHYLVEHCGIGQLMQIIMETLTRRQAKSFQFILGRHLYYTESSKDLISIHGIRWNKNVSCCEHSEQKLKITRGSWVSVHLDEFGLEQKILWQVGHNGIFNKDKRWCTLEGWMWVLYPRTISLCSNENEVLLRLKVFLKMELNLPYLATITYYEGKGMRSQKVCLYGIRY